MLLSLSLLRPKRHSTKPRSHDLSIDHLVWLTVFAHVQGYGSDGLDVAQCPAQRCESSISQVVPRHGDRMQRRASLQQDRQLMASCHNRTPKDPRKHMTCYGGTSPKQLMDIDHCIRTLAPPAPLCSMSSRRLTLGQHQDGFVFHLPIRRRSMRRRQPLIRYAQRYCFLCITRSEQWRFHLSLFFGAMYSCRNPAPVIMLRACVVRECIRTVHVGVRVGVRVRYQAA